MQALPLPHRHTCAQVQVVKQPRSRAKAVICCALGLFCVQPSPCQQPALEWPVATAGRHYRHRASRHDGTLARCSFHSTRMRLRSFFDASRARTKMTEMDCLGGSTRRSQASISTLFLLSTGKVRRRDVRVLAAMQPTIVVISAAVPCTPVFTEHVGGHLHRFGGTNVS